MFCAEYLQHQEAMGEIQPTYYECPNICGIDRKRIDNEFCKACPIGAEKAEFKEQTARALTARVPEWKRYGFDLLQSTLHAVLDLRETDKTRWTVKTGVLLGIFDIEKDRLRRIKDFNRDQAG